MDEDSVILVMGKVYTTKPFIILALLAWKPTPMEEVICEISFELNKCVYTKGVFTWTTLHSRNRPHKHARSTFKLTVNFEGKNQSFRLLN